MNTRKVPVVVALLMAATALAAGVVAAQEPADSEPQAALAAVGTAFTYQGRLTDAGSPANGAYDFEFRLYDAASGGSQVGSTVPLADVIVSNGLFTVQLDFGAAAFTGDARWLEIQVRAGASSGSYTALSPLQALTAAPYALSLRPGAAVDGATGDTILTLSGGSVGLSASGLSSGVYGQGVGADSDGVYGYSTAVGLSSGVHGRSDSVSGNGVYGAALHGSGSTRAVYGLNLSTAGTGVLGSASAGSGATYGVRGESSSTAGYGVHGVASAISGATYGVYGRSYSTSGVGVYGYASQSSGTTYGVYGRSDSTGGYGGKFEGFGTDVVYIENLGTGRGIRAIATADTAIYATTTSGIAGVDGRTGSSTGRGVFGWAQATTGVNYGVYGRSASSGGYGVYSDGNAHVVGQLTWNAITSYLSIPPAAFAPADEAYQYAQLGQKLTPNNSSSSAYYAPVSLPHGATVTKLTFYWRDTDGASNAVIALDRSAFNGFVSTMASAASSGSSGDGSATDSTIASATVDNSQYEYILGVTLPSASTSLYGVVIEYTIDRPY